MPLAQVKRVKRTTESIGLEDDGHQVSTFSAVKKVQLDLSDSDDDSDSDGNDNEKEELKEKEEEEEEEEEVRVQQKVANDNSKNYSKATLKNNIESSFLTSTSSESTQEQQESEQPYGSFSWEKLFTATNTPATTTSTLTKNKNSQQSRITSTTTTTTTTTTTDYSAASKNRDEHEKEEANIVNEAENEDNDDDDDDDDDDDPAINEFINNLTDCEIAILYLKDKLINPPRQVYTSPASSSSSSSSLYSPVPFFGRVRPGFKAEVKANIIAKSRALKASKLFPPLVLKHQLYTVLEDRTFVDRELMALKAKNQIRMFKLDQTSDHMIVMLTKDFENYTQPFVGSNQEIYDTFIKKILPAVPEVSISKQQLNALGVAENDITLLINMGLLIIRDVGSFWFSIPGIAKFSQDLVKGRKELQRVFMRAKYKEMLQSALMTRQFKSCDIHIEFLLLDLTGSEFLERIDTTSGVLYRKFR